MALMNGANSRNSSQGGSGVAKRPILFKDRAISSPALPTGLANPKKPLTRISTLTEGVSNGPRSSLFPGDELSGQDNFLRSPNGRYEAVFTSEGLVEVYLTDGKPAGDRSVIIHSRRLRGEQQHETPLMWKLNEHGHLVAMAADGSVYFSTEGTQHPDPAPGIRRLEIRNDGNVILYHGDVQIWKTTTGETSHWSIQSLYTYGAKVPGIGLLKQGSTMYNGDYLAKLENDGRLCVYQFEHDLNGIWKCEKCVWSTSIDPSKIRTYVQPFRLLVQLDGDVVVKDGQNVVVWRTRTKGKIRKQPALFQLTDDGRLELKDGDGRVVWVSGEDGHPKQNG